MAFDREKTLQAAQKYIDKRKYDRAILEYQKVVQHEPNDARTLLRIGDLQARLGSHAEAIATYDRVALYYAGRGFSLKAIAVLKQIGELIDRHAPQLADQYSHVSPKLAQIYAELGLTNDALATYDGIARRLQNRGRDRDAVEIIRRMVALERSNPLPYLRLAEALCRVTRVDEATEHFWSAAQLLTQQGRPEDAIKVLERILHFRQDVRVARVAAELYLAKGTRDAGLQALSRLQLCFEADPRDLDTLTLLAQAFDVIGQSSKGIEVYKEMVRIASETGQGTLRQRYLEHLLAAAPNDEQVRALSAMQGLSPSGRPPSVAPRSSTPPESIGEDEIEFIDDDSIPPPAALIQRSVAEPPPRVAPGRRRLSSSPELDLSGELPRPAAPQPGRTQGSEFLRKALVDAESFRELKLFTKAASSLRQALMVAPQSLELRAALQQILLEAGDQPAAVEQMLAVAQIYIERGSFPAAEAELYQVLELSPDLPAALDLLEQVESLAPEARRSRSRSVPGARFGIGPREDSTPLSQAEHEAFELRARVSTPAAEPSPAPATPAVEDGPLPAYELEDDDLMLVTTPPGASPQAEAVEPVSDAPLPQFSLDSGLHAPPESVRPARTAPLAPRVPANVSVIPAVIPTGPSLSPASVGFRRDDGSESAFGESVSSSQRVPPSRRESIRASLDEAEFFSSRGLYQDATMILRDKLEQYPGDAELIEAIARIEPKLSTESGTRDVGRLSEDDLSADDDLEETTSGQNRAVGAPLKEDTHDTSGTGGKELRVQFSTDGTLEAGPIIDADADLELVSSLEQPRDQQIDVDEVFAKFKQGVKAQVSDSDSATHYDLGVAYKEMGLLADAAREFEIASRDPKRECNSLAMMGMMFRERGELDRSAEAYVRGLNAAQKTIAQEVSLYYDLGIIYEMKDDPDEAIYYFQRITRRDPTYRDVAQRLKVLLPRSRRFSQPARAINDDKEFERSFDDLYKPE